MSNLEVFNGHRALHESAARAMELGRTPDEIQRAISHADLSGWLALAGKFDMERLSEGTGEAVRMPIPSSPIRSLREAAGYPNGIATTNGGWSLAVSEGLSPGERYDTGVQLVNHRRVSEDEVLQVPLDVVMHGPSISLNPGRPDRVMMMVGDRQLVSPVYFRGEVGQRLLSLTQSFLAGIVTVPEPQPVAVNKQPWWDLRRLTSGRS